MDGIYVSGYGKPSFHHCNRFSLRSKRLDARCWGTREARGVHACSSRCSRFLLLAPGARPKLLRRLLRMLDWIQDWFFACRGNRFVSSSLRDGIKLNQQNTRYPVLQASSKTSAPSLRARELLAPKYLTKSPLSPPRSPRLIQLKKDW